jgi:hypothetical protein
VSLALRGTIDREPAQSKDRHIMAAEFPDQIPRHSREFD